MAKTQFSSLHLLCSLFSDMLEWMEESSRLVRERYLCKRHLVDNFFPDDPQLCDTFVRQWREGDTDMINTIEGIYT